MTDDFFEKLEAQAANLKEQARTAREIEHENIGFPEAATLQMREVATAFVKRLNPMGYRTNLTVSTDSLSLQLTWGDNTSIILNAGRAPATDQLRYEMKGRLMYSALVDPQQTFDRRYWTVAGYEHVLRQFVQGFTDEAGEHGGI